MPLCLSECMRHTTAARRKVGHYANRFWRSRRGLSAQRYFGAFPSLRTRCFKRRAIMEAGCTAMGQPIALPVLRCGQCIGKYCIPRGVSLCLHIAGRSAANRGSPTKLCDVFVRTASQVSEDAQHSRSSKSDCGNNSCCSLGRSMDLKNKGRYR